MESAGSSSSKCRRGGVAVLVGAGLALAPAAGLAHVVDGSTADWHGAATMVPGTAAYAGGEWAFTDYVYDDRGTGAYAYPAGHGGNAADVVVLEIASDPDAVRYLVRLNTMLAPDSTVVALAVDTDCDEGTGGGAWPFGAGVSTSGWEHVVTAWGTGARVSTASGSVEVAASADVVGNVIELEVPRSVADPGTGTWCYRGGAGLWDADAGAWRSADAPNGVNVVNLLFRNRLHDAGTDATDENASPSFQYAKQSAALAAGDLGPFVREVDFAVLASGATVGPPPVTTDHHFTRVYASAGFPNGLPEGVSRGENAVSGSLYNGRHQPYVLFVPASYWAGLPEPAPMFPMLHGWTGDHRSFNPADNAFWNDVVRANRALVAKTLGRGQEVWYEHVGELDTLEVIDDVARHYAIDPDRVYLAGTSMGGLGTVKIAEQHPDRFAAIFPSVPPMSDRAQGYALPANNDWDLAELVGSLRNVPVRNFTGTYDGLVPAGNDSRRFCDELRAQVFDHDCWRDVSPGGTHRGYEVDRAAEIATLMSEHPRRVVDPAHVTYRSHPVFRRQAAAAGIGDLLRYDAVYWVSGIRWPAPPEDGGCALASCPESPGVPTWPTDPGTPRRLLAGEGISTIDVRTFGTGESDPVATEITDDPSPTLVRSGLVLTPGPAVAPRNEFALSVERVIGLDLDLARMSLTMLEPLAATLSGDGVVDLGLVGPGEDCVAAFDGAPVPVVRDGERIVLTLPLTATPRSLEVSCR